MLNDRLIQDLVAERDHLRRHADLIDDFLRGVSDSRDDRPEAVPLVHPANWPMALNGNFAASVRHAMTQIGQLATSRQVAARMIQDGMPSQKNGKPLRGRVAVELFRMSKKGTGGVRRVARGKYRIETTSQDVG